VKKVEAAGEGFTHTFALFVINVLDKIYSRVFAIKIKIREEC